MPYLVQYKMECGTLSGEKVVVTIYKTSSFAGSGTPVITELKAVTDNPFSVNVIDNDNNKFKPIRGKQATIRFLSQSGITAKTFSIGADDEWLVEAVIETTGFILFKGYLVMDDHEGMFLPIGTYTVTLSATDNLGTLSEVPLTDDSGNYIRGHKKLIDAIAQCLRKTGLQLDIIVRDTWMEESQTTFMTGLNFAYVEMKTFEKEINEAVDCKTALEIICDYRLSIKQYNGQWWVENIDEKNSNDVYAFKFDYTGAYVSQLTVAPYNKTIGKIQSTKFIGANALEKYVRPYKYTKLTYNYEFPKEIVDNVDYSRGDLYVPLDMSPITIDGITYYVSKTHIDDWALERIDGGTVQINAYTRRLFSDSNKTYEKERVIVFSDGQTSTHWLKSSPIYIHAGDKISVSVDRRLPVRWGGSGDVFELFAHVRLFGDDGSVWTYQNYDDAPDKEGKWETFLLNYIGLTYNKADIQNNQWQTAAGTSAPAPVSGTVHVYLLAAHLESPYRAKETHFSNVRIDYIPLINGDYSKYNGQYSKIEQSGNYKANIDDRVRLGDSQKKLFKGSMFKLVGGAYILTERWFAGGDLLRQGITPPYPPNSSYLHPFGHLQTYAVWNQYNRQFVTLEGDVKGLQLDTTQPDLIHAYDVDAAVTEVENKTFMLVSGESDYKSDQLASVSLVEVEDSTIPKDYTTPLIFKYEGGGK